ncbi:thiosulfate oxidation carrier protein SoxY [Candidatus Aalborgicola defluviihabitans]|jgi:sulfur-oxidizing protein SoxY|uniref:thiosulfate oxidation carrier protein SoxY n=1 Tax=Candidatus Aalborgicola defluviihabitans TaxID=3386187 RepID=UPI001DAF0D5B|nr:thiosulfate oxidation carrier protein SoxY [Burkholderiales bacterium]MBK6570695.1 thiosulfate oxidation carrier protein SoxY [Burkholderiales bacterium]MBK7279690.1 thiosulfate oxidation carrier protein SoxY [Burkholderiales bacterium]MBK7312624.1 thiosulfate oxidation carrier protein SoxY [Burkholderiales bacterium]MBL0243433.1 thiosulfate oxidation carrier protein SoxY [Rhodoferax sp.]
MTTRRELLKQSTTVAAMLASLGMYPHVAWAQSSTYNAAAFEAKNMGDLMKALGGGTPQESKDVVITGSDIAENGAVVPVGASTTLPGVKRMLILVEKNPSMMSAMFDVTDAIDANFATRVKMGQSSNVFAVAMMDDGKVLFASKEIKVTLGGCGG